MDAAIYFLSLFQQFDKEKQRNILGNIFLISFVSEFDVSIFNDSIIFNLYVFDVFYQISFQLENAVSDVYFLKREEDRISTLTIFVANYGKCSERYCFDVLSNIFLSNDKKAVDSFLSTFL